MYHFSHHKNPRLQAENSIIAQIQCAQGETIQHFEIISHFLQFARLRCNNC